MKSNFVVRDMRNHPNAYGSFPWELVERANKTVISRHRTRKEAREAWQRQQTNHSECIEAA